MPATNTFKNESEAQARVDYLRKEGIAATYRYKDTKAGDRYIAHLGGAQ